MKLLNKTFFRSLAAFLLIGMISATFLCSTPVFASGTGDSVAGNGQSSSGQSDNKKETNCITEICKDIDKEAGDQPGGAIVVILKRVIQIFSAVIGVLAVVGIIASGLQYVLAADDAGKVKAAKERIVQIIIGIILYIFMATILHFLVPGGILGGGPLQTTKLVAQAASAQGVIC